MARNSTARAMMSKKKQTTTGGGPGHPGLVDPTNLGIDLGSTVGDTTPPEMTIGGTADVPIADAGVEVGTVDLSGSDLRGGATDDVTEGKREIEGGATDDVKEDKREIEGGALDATDKDKSKRMYNVVEVIGSGMPSQNAKYVGATPSMALNKAARRIHKKNPSKLQFSVLMRRVSPKHSERELYMYDVTMVKDPKPQGFVTFEVDTFDHTEDGIQKNSLKKVRVIQSSEQPVFGYIDVSSKGIKDTNPTDKQYQLVRTPGTNTLSVVIPGPLPLKIYDLTVVRTEWKVTSERNKEISESLREKYDTASHTRERENNVIQREKERATKKKEVAKANAKAQEEKEKAAALKKRTRERAALKKERDAQEKADKIQKEKAKKEALKAKAEALKLKAPAKK